MLPMPLTGSIHSKKLWFPFKWKSTCYYEIREKAHWKRCRWTFKV